MEVSDFNGNYRVGGYFKAVGADNMREVLTDFSAEVVKCGEKMKDASQIFCADQGLIGPLQVGPNAVGQSAEYSYKSTFKDVGRPSRNPSAENHNKNSEGPANERGENQASSGKENSEGYFLGTSYPILAHTPPVGSQ